MPLRELLFALADPHALLQWLGRTHVVIVHFPIALLLLAGLVELWRAIRRAQEPAAFSVVAVALGTLAAAWSVGAGLVHRTFGEFAGDAAVILTRHQWLGIAAALAGGLALACRWLRAPLWTWRAATLAGAVLVGATGHLGGNLTHGPGYLTDMFTAGREPPAAAPKKGLAAAVKFPANGKVDFVKHVQPILAESCNECHGPSVRRGGLRLDSKPAALKGGKAGPAVVPHDVAKSSLLARIAADLEPAKRMPQKKPPLSAEHVRILQAWVEQGASWPDAASFEGGVEKKHWAYVPPSRLAPPAVKAAAWPRNPVDHFILARLEAEKLAPSPAADRATLLRRASLDLIGLPPSPAETDGILADQRPDAYERAVDRLLASPRYGERWARPWLDLARYADSNGYEKDRLRSIWPWRDWVIDALNRDLPFDQFTLEQLAGDLLPGATVAQRIATGFHRNTMLNQEAGTDPEEFRTLAVVDRVNTTATVWLGSTLACAQCHDHKFDAFSQKEYFQLFAFFNQTADETRMIKGSEIEDISPRLKLPRHDEPELRAQIAALEQKIAATDFTADLAAWETGRAAAAATAVPAVMPPPPAGGTLPAPAGTTAATADPVPAPPAAPPEIAAILAVESAARTVTQREQLAAWFRPLAPTLRAPQAELARLTKLLATPLTTLVLEERAEPRATFVHQRGNFLTPGDPVGAGVPAVLPPLPADAPRNRLALARWLVSPDNPLTARVTVNRMWEAFFGRGIVATSEDFGIQGAEPTHPELLDWLATEFVRVGWSVKAMHRLIVTSATYRQSAAVTPALLERDPANTLLARGPRFRLEAELIRDQALAVAGLLSDKQGGPGVFPSQPANIWSFAYNTEKWTPSTGADRHRRGLYTIWRRSAPYPSFLSFDATTREAICTRRSRSNTPLQALTTLNDPQFFEAAVGLARRILCEAGPDAGARAIHGFRLAVVRLPQAEEVGRLLALLREQEANFAQDPAAAQKLVGAYLPAGETSTPELAAWTVVANVLLNLDETLTKG